MGKFVDWNLVFGRNIPVFVDGSSFTANPTWFPEHVKKLNYYGHLNLELISSICEDYQKLFSKLDTPSAEAFFTPHTTREILTFRKILSKKIEDLEKNYPRNPRSGFLERRRSLLEAQIWYRCLCDFATDNTYYPLNEEDFNKVKTRIVNISRDKNVKYKRHNAFLIENIKKEDWKRTDEEIIASAVCHSIWYDIPCGIFTGDFHFADILESSMFDIVDSKDEFMKTQKLKQNPVWIYNRAGDFNRTYIFSRDFITYRENQVKA